MNNIQLNSQIYQFLYNKQFQSYLSFFHILSTKSLLVIDLNLIFQAKFNNSYLLLERNKLKYTNQLIYKNFL
ncbi:hypothetical protein pb186bvf_017414 [Paramecium bursaria]